MCNEVTRNLEKSNTNYEKEYKLRTISHIYGSRYFSLLRYKIILNEVRTHDKYTHEYGRERDIEFACERCMIM